MYLDLDLLYKMRNNNLFSQWSTMKDCLSSTKGYSIINHAYETVNNNDDLYLADAISNLRKAVNYRVNDIYSNLGINSLNFPLGKDKKLEKLESLGIIKSLLINKLLTIRNGIEYRGDNPPSKENCEELIDVVWYFYRSTDRYCNFELSDWLTEWEEEGKECFITVDFDLKQHSSININARCPEKYLSDIKNSSAFIPLKNIEIKNIFEDDDVKNLNYYPYYFTGEIETDKIPNYLEMFSLILEEWMN